MNQQTHLHIIALNDALAINALKAHIITQAQALYGAEAPTNHPQPFSILLYQKGLFCMAKLIVYTEPASFAKFKVLCECTQRLSKLKNVLEGLGESVQREINSRIPDLKVGETWDGLPSYHSALQ